MKHDLNVVGIDIAKRIFHLVGLDDRGKIILRKRLMRGEVMVFMAKLPRVTVGMEACSGSHYWARQLREQGHEVKLMGLCRKFSLEASCGMVSPGDSRDKEKESDHGGELQGGPFPQGYYPDGGALVTNGISFSQTI